MAQRISSTPYSLEVYGDSLAQRGLIGMNPGNQGVANANDTGTGALPVHDPMAPRFDHGIQNLRQNTYTARIGANTEVRQAAVKQNTTANNAQYFMMNKLTTTLLNDLEASGGGSAMMALNEIMQNPAARGQFTDDIRTTKNMYRNIG